MIAVTAAVGEKYELMASLAAASCREKTGLRTEILGAEHCRKYSIKPLGLPFCLFEEFPDEEQILFFDSDTIFLKPFDPRSAFNSEDLLAVRDRYDTSFIIDDAQRIGIEPNEYFNAGVFVVNRSRHREYLAFAAKLFQANNLPFLDQTAMNMARKMMNLPITYLPEKYNHIQFFLEPENTSTIIGHFISHNVKPLTLKNIQALYDAPYDLPSLYRDSQ